MIRKPGLTVGLETPLDELLADIAIRTQLSRTAHRLAEERYETIQRWIERDGSLLAGLVELLYPQGSMSIGAAIASNVTNEEYDLDIVVQGKVPVDWTPENVLDALYLAIRGERGSQYYDKVERRTRCVTVSYSDMHLDLTPMERNANAPEREGNIFHHKEGTQDMARVVANPFGFAEWFLSATEDKVAFSEAYAERASVYEIAALKAADAEPVPDPEPAAAKSLAVVALQLIKRWRNVQYMNRPGRKPPSVMLSELVGKAAGTTSTLSAELLHQATSMRGRFRAAEADAKRIHVVNPVCSLDIFTDRWPDNALEQRMFLTDLEHFVESLEQLQKGVDLGVHAGDSGKAVR